MREYILVQVMKRAFEPASLALVFYRVLSIRVIFPALSWYLPIVQARQTYSPAENLAAPDGKSRVACGG